MGSDEVDLVFIKPHMRASRLHTFSTCRRTAAGRRSGIPSNGLLRPCANRICTRNDSPSGGVRQWRSRQTIDTGNRRSLFDSRDQTDARPDIWSVIAGRWRTPAAIGTNCEPRPPRSACPVDPTLRRWRRNAKISMSSPLMTSVVMTPAEASCGGACLCSSAA